jgi:hypothetical protein
MIIEVKFNDGTVLTLNTIELIPKYGDRVRVQQSKEGNIAINGIELLPSVQVGAATWLEDIHASRQTTASS